MLRPVACIAAIVAASIAAASAETPEQRQACTDDAFQFCSHAIPDRNRVFSCLIERRAEISALCVAGLAPFLPQQSAPKPAVARKPVKAAAKPAAKRAAKPATRPAATKTAAKSRTSAPLKLTPSGR